MSDPQVEGDDGSSAPAQRRGRTVPVGAFLVVVLLAVALGVLAVFAATIGSSDSEDAQDREIRLAAGRFTEQFLTFDHADLDGWRDVVLSLSTGAFASEVEDVESGLRQLIATNELDAITQVTEIFVGEFDNGAVQVVVTYDRTVDGADGRRTESDRYMQLSLVRVDGVWLVDNVIDIATTGGIGAPEPVQPE